MALVSCTAGLFIVECELIVHCWCYYILECEQTTAVVYCCVIIIIIKL